ncbi:general transcription factor 3C polypeptide 5-like [Pollicipes pollicipes]|uniref:general transcription factor 3C polypeptide 5-like n=1 Tax=Pollicipes pollicipes TaxID=41117 RepID=UPI001884C757|nr:general transcription factor 3C polypeptide 5-like [Pollicipes pollicipes]XP_037083420.1 general transcription factor 3C polypeptide 5-like [Pollicipes pollicipes]
MAQKILDPQETPQIICIEFPALVEDEEKAVKCLGGMDNINKVIADPGNRRMELRFRPDDVFCKPTCTEPKDTQGLLLRVKCRRKKNSTEPPVFSTELLGVLGSTFRFTNMCDFQFLPMDETGKSIYDQVVPTSCLDTEYPNRQAPLFVPPVAFSRVDTPQNYCYRRPPTNRLMNGPLPEGRRRRRYGAQAVSHLQPNMPQQPLVDRRTFEERVRIRGLLGDLSQLKQLFEERPVMSRALIYFRMGGTKDRLKYLLPLAAYYFNTGPWRNMWVRLGYDPRTDPHAWKYQIIDYRTRSAVLKNKMALKRALSVVPYRSVNASKHKMSSINAKNLEDVEKAKEEPRIDTDFAFRPGMVPTARQIFYQYCDIEVPEVSNVLAEAPTSTYSPELGWIRSGTEEHVRTIITSHVDAFVASNSADGGAGDLSDLSDADDPDVAEEPDTDDSDEDGDADGAGVDGT